MDTREGTSLPKVNTKSDKPVGRGKESRRGGWKVMNLVRRRWREELTVPSRTRLETRNSGTKDDVFCV